MKTSVDKKFVHTVLEYIDLKVEFVNNDILRFILRAMMAGMVILFGYLVVVAVDANFAEADAGARAFAKIFSSGFFSLCLVTIYFTKSELFTSNMMMTAVGKYFDKITFSKMFKILILCYIGNFLGGLMFSLILGPSTILQNGYMETMQEMVNHKLSYIGSISGIVDLVIRGIFCNFFINLSMLMVYSGNIKSDLTKVIAVFFGVFIFMYLGLEHSVANTVFFTAAFFQDFFHPGTLDINLIDAVIQVFWVIIGNFIGGGIFIGLYYSFLNKKLPMDM